jgi:Flp pilus assembly protein TadD
MNPVAVEREHGLADRVILAPLPTAWILGAALVGALALLRRPLRHFPEWVLFLLPLVVVLVFFYTPRYRGIGAPLFCGLAALALLRFREFRCPAFVCGLVFVLPPLLTLLNVPAGIDRPDSYRTHYAWALSQIQVRLGDEQAASGRLAEAEQRYRAALKLAPDNANAYRQLGVLLARRGRVGEGQNALARALEIDPTDRLALAHMYNNHCAQGHFVAAADTLRRALTSAAPGDELELRLALAWLLATSSDAHARDGGAAVEQARAALRIAGEKADVMDVLAAAYAEAGRFDDAVFVGSQAAEVARRQGAPALADEIQRRVDGYRERNPGRAGPRLLHVEQPP